MDIYWLLIQNNSTWYMLEVDIIEKDTINEIEELFSVECNVTWLSITNEINNDEYWKPQFDSLITFAFSQPKISKSSKLINCNK